MKTPQGTGPRWLPHPVVSLLVAAAWLLLQESLAPAHLLTAAVLALVVPLLLKGFLGPRIHLRSPRLIPRFVLQVLRDIVMSNLRVARIVLDPTRDPQPCWVRVPLELEHPSAVVLLASIITMTPGTVSCVIDEERREILVHALDCSDPVALVADIKLRYERPLMEMIR